jgi:hypothetical protein
MSRPIARRRELNGDPAAVGRSLRVAHDLLTVVGVLPPGVELPRRSAAAADVLLPLAISPAEVSTPGTRAGLFGIARLKPGVSLAAARAELDAIVRGMSGYGIVVDPMRDYLTADAAPPLRAAFAGVLLLLAISCANVTLLLLLRGTVRGRELAIRSALGAGVRRIAIQQVAETLLLAATGGALGVAVAALAIRGLIALAPPGIPRLNELHPDGRMAAFAVAVTLVSGGLAGAVSAWHALRPDLFPLLKNGGHGTTAGGSRSRSRDALLVAQLALGLVLAASAGLLLRSLQRFSQVPLGFDPTDRTAALVYPREKASDTFAQPLLAAARGIPGAEAATLVKCTPVYDQCDATTFRISGRNAPPTDPDLAAVNWFSPVLWQPRACASSAVAS